MALQEAAESVTGERGDALKRRLRTGTVVTYDDRNWELRYSQERHRINLGRAIAIDMESATLATQGYRMRVPYGTLLCVSDKPLHGEIKLPGAANALLRAGGRASTCRSAWRRWTCCAANWPRCTRASCAASTSRRSGDGMSSCWEPRSGHSRWPRASRSSGIACGRSGPQDHARDWSGALPANYSGHSHAAPRTPLESPCLGGSSRVAMWSGSEKT